MELEKVVEKEWALSNITIARTLQKNGERFVYLVEAQEGTFVLKVFHPALTVNEIERYTDVLLFLERTGFHHAPRIIRLPDRSAFTSIEGRFMYLMEYISGSEVLESEEDEYQLGAVLAKLHGIQGYVYDSNIDVPAKIHDMLSRFGEFPFKEEYDRVVMNLPDFAEFKQSLIHTDICPKNALKRGGEIILIDFDDAGNGSIFIDLGYPLITQFVEWENRVIGHTPPDGSRLYFKFKMARAFYDGYFSVAPMTDHEKRLIFAGAVFMQLIYMPCFGKEAVPYLWRQLAFALENESLLLEALRVK